ncbi:MAG: hypothetical protein EBT97_04725 [Actinobacteria bacterium]|nr:hypothetical protein [Actinomycetota bacterium]
MAPRRPAGVVLFPGSGSSSDHPSLVALEEALAPLPVARVDFPYRRQGRAFPDRAPVLLQCVRDEVRAFAASLGVPTSRLHVASRHRRPEHGRADVFHGRRCN